MNKVLLVYEDYSELMSLEGLLKRVGFDVIGVTSEYSVADQVLAFNPDIVVGSGRGGKVSSIGVGKRLKEMTRWQGKCILIFPPNYKPAPQDLMRIRTDMVLEAPVINARVVQIIGKLLGENEELLIERLAKLSASESSLREAGIPLGTSAKVNSTEEAIYVRGSTSDGNSESKSEEKFEAISEPSSETLPVDSLENPSTSGTEKKQFKFDLKSDSVGVRQSGSEALPENQKFSDVDLRALESELLGGGTPAIEKIDAKSQAVPASGIGSFKEPLHGSSSKSQQTLGKSADDPGAFGDSTPVSIESLEEELRTFGSTEPQSTTTNYQKNHSSYESTEAFDLMALEKELTSYVPSSAPGEFADVSAESVQSEIDGLQAKALKDLAKSAERLRSKMAKYQALTADMKLPLKSQVTRVEARRRFKIQQNDVDNEKNSDNDKLRREFAVALFKK